MRPRFYTIGMAGHVDHGKTTLTKALTGVDTDRLAEEKKRQISIELGFAPFPLDDYTVSIVDVPGHEKFIRQMIAGVAGIDLVILVVAADEGVMPQTREHLEILTFLGVEQGIIAITKVDRVDSEFLALIEEDIGAAVRNSLFAGSPMIAVDSLGGRGLDDLKSEIRLRLAKTPERNVDGAFRLPIDQVFTLQGHGTIVRGTIYEGAVEAGAALTVLPQMKTVKVREMQVHNQPQSRVVAGQRVAIKIGGLSKTEIRRGDVLVAASSDFVASDIIDVSLQMVQALQRPVKQRTPVKFHSGTAEVMGKIVFFDRNEIEWGGQTDQAGRGGEDGQNGQADEVLCQIRLDEPVVLRRGDRFVIRRPSPIETIGGGWVINPFGGKYRFGEQTVRELARKRAGSPEDRILDALIDYKVATKADISRITSLPYDSLDDVLFCLKQDNKVLELDSGCLTTVMVYNQVRNLVVEQLVQYHEAFPMHTGMNKAACIQVLARKVPRKFAELVIDREVAKGGEEVPDSQMAMDSEVEKRLWVIRKQFICLAGFEPHFPKQWNINMEHVMARLRRDGLSMLPWEEYLACERIPVDLRSEMKHFVLQSQLGYQLDDKCLIHCDAVRSQLAKLYHGTNGQPFDVQVAKVVLDASRSHLILFLELLDQLHITKRIGDKRIWIGDNPQCF